MARIRTLLRRGAASLVVLVSANNVHAAPNRAVMPLAAAERSQSTPDVHEPVFPEDPPTEYALRGDERAPPGYRVEHRSRKAPLYTGALLGGTAYAVGLSITTAKGFENSGGWLALPLAGPWLTLASRHPSRDCRELFCDVPIVFGLVLDGGVQFAAAVLLTVAFAAPRRWAVREVPVLISPLFSSGTYGVVLGTSL